MGNPLSSMTRSTCQITPNLSVFSSLSLLAWSLMFIVLSFVHAPAVPTKRAQDLINDRQMKRYGKVFPDTPSTSHGSTPRNYLGPESTSAAHSGTKKTSLDRLKAAYKSNSTGDVHSVGHKHLHP